MQNIDEKTGLDQLDHVVNVPGQFSYESGILATEVSRDFARGVLTVGKKSRNPGGKVHGGALVTLADTVAGCCACSRGGNCVTANQTMEFLRPADGREIVCVATPKKMGRSLSVVQVTLTDDTGEAVATGTFTFFMMWDNRGQHAKNGPASY